MPVVKNGETWDAICPICGTVLCDDTIYITAYECSKCGWRGYYTELNDKKVKETFFCNICGNVDKLRASCQSTRCQFFRLCRPGFCKKATLEHG